MERAWDGARDLESKGQAFQVLSCDTSRAQINRSVRNRFERTAEGRSSQEYDLIGERRRNDYATLVSKTWELEISREIWRGVILRNVREVFRCCQLADASNALHTSERCHRGIRGHRGS